MVWIQIRTDILSVLIWVQTVCKGYQHPADDKVAACKERVKPPLFFRVLPYHLRRGRPKKTWSECVKADILLIVTLIVGVCSCSVFCWTLLCVRSSNAIILMGKRELVALLYLSSWCPPGVS